jgi:hypothetical protein
VVAGGLNERTDVTVEKSVDAVIAFLAISRILYQIFLGLNEAGASIDIEAVGRHKRTR